MRVIRKFTLTLAVLATSIAVLAGTARADSRMFVAYLYGGNEVPGPADPDAFGIATVVIGGSAGSLCYSIILRAADSATAAHIHSGAAGVAGAILLPLPVTAGMPTRVAGCVTTTTQIISDIRSHPQDFYVNVHTGTFPNGAARGQLQ